MCECGSVRVCVCACAREHWQLCCAWNWSGRAAFVNNIFATLPLVQHSTKHTVHVYRLRVASGTFAIVNMCLRVLLRSRRLSRSPRVAIVLSHILATTVRHTQTGCDAVSHMFLACLLYLLFLFIFISRFFPVDSSLFVAAAFGKSPRVRACAIGFGPPLFFPRRV